MSIQSNQRRWVSPPPTYDLQNASTLKPYLTLPYLLSLTWLAYPILSLLFVAFRLQISSAQAQDAVSDAKDNLLTSCSAAEQAATAAASMPRFMAIATNNQIADAVNGTMNAAREALVLALTILEGVINFVIDIYRSTFFCFLELVVRGGLAVIIGAVQEFNSFLSSTLNGIRTSIQSDVATANSAIQSAIGALNKINPFGNISVPQFNIPSLSALQNVTLPPDFENALLKLNSSLPSLDQIRDAIESVVDSPFEDLKADINNTFAGLTFDSSTLPVPSVNTVSFCGQLDTSVVDDLGRDLLKAAKIGTIILIILAILLLAGNCALEWYKWRCLRNHLEYTRQAWVTDSSTTYVITSTGTPSMVMTDHNLLMLSASSSHPLLTRIANQLSRIFRLSPTQYTNLQWFFHYVFHPPALACFLIGFFGLLSVEMQLLAVRPLEVKYDQQVTASINSFSNTIATQINASMFNQSATYANQINSRVATVQSTVNDGLFGWVNGTTTTLNDTLATFYSDIQNAVSTVFNGTVLESPMQDFVRCIIGTKVEAIEDALTFLHNNLAINIPQVNESILVLSPTDVNDAVQPVSRAALGGGTNNSQGLVGQLIERYVDSLHKELVMFGVFMGLWLFVVLMALCIILWHSYGKSYYEARRKRKWQREQGGAVDSFQVSFKKEVETYPTEKNGPNGSVSRSSPDLHSFTPALSPRNNTFFNINIRSPTGRQDPEAPAERPMVQRSWDSFLDSRENGRSDEETEPLPLPGALPPNGPRKLLAIGRKALGRERFVSDEERARMRAAGESPEDGEETQGGWMKRVTTAFRKKDQTDQNPSSERDDDSGFSDLPASSERTKPKLTITTNAAFTNVPRNDLPTAADDVPMKSPEVANPTTANIPGSAWSISPDPRQSLVPVSWFVNPLKNKSKNAPPPPTSFNFKPNLRRNVSVPSSIHSTFEPSSFGNDVLPPTTPEAAKLPVQTPVSATSQPGIPSYYHKNFPQDVSRESYLPENMFSREHKRTSSVPVVMNNGPARNVVTRPGPSVRSRKLSLSDNPFATPFDDEARVDTTDKRGSVTNPFSPIAL